MPVLRYYRTRLECVMNSTGMRVCRPHLLDDEIREQRGLHRADGGLAMAALVGVGQRMEMGLEQYIWR